MRAGVDGLVVGGQPELVVRGGPHLPDDSAGDGAPHGGVQVGGQTALGLDGGEVLGPIAGAAAQVCQNPSTSLGKCRASSAARRSS